MLAAFIMIMINPFVLTDIGFQLSFMATTGIILFKDSLQRFLVRIPSPFSEDLTTTIAAQLLVVPIIFFHFGQISVISVFVNTLVLWTVPLATILGFGIAIFGLFLEPFGQIIAWIAWVPLSIFTVVVEIFAKIPLAQIQVPENNLITLVVYYLLLIISVQLFSKYVKTSKKNSK